MPDDHSSHLRAPPTAEPENDAAAIEIALSERAAWPTGLEALYEFQRGPARRTRAARAIAVSGLIFQAVSLIDALDGRALFVTALPWRIALLIACLCCAVLLRRLRAGTCIQRAEAALTIVPPLAIMMLTQVVGEYGGRWADRYMMAAAFAVAGFISTTPMTRRAARFLGAAAVLAYPLVPALLPRALPLAGNIDLPVFAAGILGTSLLVARRNENARRARFLFRRRHEIVNAEMDVMNAELRRLSTTDALTGLRNRRAFTQALAGHWQDRRQALALAIFDVDWFKAYNDAAGHAAGDRALQSVAEAAEGAVRRDVDLAARIGGEEFAVIMPGLEEAQAASLAEHLREAIAALALPHPGRDGCRLSISVGVAWCSAAGRAGRGSDSLMHEADMALYAAKAAGRDRVVLAGKVPA